LLAGYEGMAARERAIPTQDKVCLAGAVERIVQLYEDSGQTEKVAQWRATLPPDSAERPVDVFARPWARCRAPGVLTIVAGMRPGRAGGDPA
jgi:hypothetical protein